MENPKLFSIGETAKMMGISVDTLRRWEKQGKFPSIRSAGGHRYFRLEDINIYLVDITFLAKKWVTTPEPTTIPSDFYCQNSSVFQARLSRFENELGQVPALAAIFPLISSAAGEIGNNSFDHNLGNWPDLPGIFFGYDINKRKVVLADRGQGILKTLKRVRQSLQTDVEAVKVAFTEVLSGRAPEARGNGLKYVRGIVSDNPFSLIFGTGNAELFLKQGDEDLNIQTVTPNYIGCFAQLTF
ncbi:MAG: Regulatory protein, MerR [Candidatus Magasanikbacteria bacterium GW2011_GWA2_56_11]|uniref:Regulatory protein, MerR n=1 Tax=Candidatus Magasanikbacteria bacterium GW2011_GWA2_56_11 TaxID=1619044 RepID=A0A0G1YFW7_9BACT|nr:MAG: Regulatory protein, MerR [Candidatus Magasanikbacteria bacterium GW2011_GWA2_56_11]